jgi:hypothetical protein
MIEAYRFERILEILNTDMGFNVQDFSHSFEMTCALSLNSLPSDPRAPWVSARGISSFCISYLPLPNPVSLCLSVRLFSNLILLFSNKKRRPGKPGRL